MRTKSGAGRQAKISRSAKRALSPEPARASPFPRWTRAALVLMIAGVPLAILPARFETYDTTSKIVVLCLGLAVLLWSPSRWFFAVVSLWRTRTGRTFYSILIAGVVALFLASAFSSDRWLSFAGTVWRRLGAVEQAIVFFSAAVLAALVYVDKTAAKTVMLGMEAAGVAASVYAILQYAGWDPLIPAHVYTLGPAAVVRPPATLTQATYFATFLLGPILIAAWFRLRETSSRWKRTHEAALVLMTAALILSGTRSALLGLAAGGCVLIYAERAVLAKRAALVRMCLATFLFAAAVATFLLLPVGRSVRARLTQWTSDRAGGPRLLIWRDSLPLVWRHPIAGIGPELFEPEFRKVESVDLARAFPDHYHESPHNFLLEIATSEGLLGVAAWLSFGYLACWSGLVGLRRGAREAGPLSAAFIATLISLQFCPLTLTNELYLLVFGSLLVAFAARTAESRSEALPPALAVSAKALSAALVLLAAVYVAQAVFYTTTEMRAARGDLDAAERSYGAARIFPMPGPNLAISQQIASLTPRFPALLRQQAMTLAAQAAEAAELGGAERFHAFYQSATLAILSRDLPRAETKLRAAINAAPVWYRPRMALACVLWWQGRDQEAQREGTLALQLAGRLQTNVKRTLQGARAQAAAMAVARGS